MPAPTPLRRPARLRRRAAARPGQRRRAVLHHVRHHFPAQVRAARPAHPAGARRGGGARLRLRPGHPRAGQRAVLRRLRLLHAGQRAGARRAGGLLPGVRRGGLGARDSRTRHHSYLRQQRGPDRHHARGRARRPGVGAAVRLRQLHPGAGRHAGPGAAAGRAADGLVRIERTPGAGRWPADDAGPGDVSARLLPGGALVHPEARVRARDPESGAVLPPGQSGEWKSVRPV